MNLYDINHIKPLLNRHGFHLSKGLGQNFLIDGEVPRAIAEGAGLTPETGVVEVGPGIGVLSRELCLRARKVVAVELDRRLMPLLAETMGEQDNFVLTEGDILKTDLPALCAAHLGEGSLAAVANLPYYITTPAITALMESGCFRTITVMVQREVAHRICARPGTSDYGAFSLYIGYYAAPQIILEVPAASFLPAPKVDSAVVRLDMLQKPPVDCDPKLLFAVIKAAFGQRRKTLANALPSGMNGKITKNEAIELLKNAGIREDIRGEALDIFQFAHIAEIIGKKS